MAPVLVEVTRGSRVESRHRGAVIAVETSGRVVVEMGDPELEVLPRSVVKALQALPLITTGAADALGLDDQALALVCASHNAEPDHVAAVEALLAAVGATVDDLACGPHWPYRQATALDLARSGGTAGAVHNNCSGKHAGFLALAHHLGVPGAGYTHPAHPVQQAVRSALEAVCGVSLGTPAIDGCSAPTWALPLRNLALGFARFGTGAGLDPAHASAADRLRGAVAAEPFFVAGTGRFCTEVMTVTGPRAFVKLGAEGIYAGCVPEVGVGIALKIEDGSIRAAEIVMATLLARFLPDLDLRRFTRQPVTTWNGVDVGQIRPGPVLAG